MTQPTAPVMTTGMQDHGVPFDLFIQALTLQLDKAQASMALKARVGKLPLTFAVKDVSLDLRAFVNIVNDDIWVRPAGPGEEHASSIKLALTTVTKPMIDENAVNYQAEDPKFSIKEALGDKISEDETRQLERMGVHTIQQLQELRKNAGADVVARLTRMPVNRLQQAMLAAAAPRVTRIETPSIASPGPVNTAPSRPTVAQSPVAAPPRVIVQAPSMRPGLLPKVRVQGQEVPTSHGHDGHLVIEPLVSQLGLIADIDFGDGEVAHLPLHAGSLGSWRDDTAQPEAAPQPPTNEPEATAGEPA